MYPLLSLQVEVQKRETERQALLRTRSYTYHREQLAAEDPLKLTPRWTDDEILIRSCSKALQAYPGEVAMGVSRKEYLRHCSPAFWVTRRPQYVSLIVHRVHVCVLKASLQPTVIALGV